MVAGAGDRFERMAFSELEPSLLDPGEHGKRLSVDLDSGAGPDDWFAGNLQKFSTPDGVVERLSVQIDVERFSANGAHVYLVASIESDHPYELRLAVYQYNDSPAIEELTLTATMGNYERLRQLWLKDRVVSSLELYAGYEGDDFAEHGTYPLSEMLRDVDGNAMVLATSNEASPGDAASTAAVHWHYAIGRRLTQYWRVPADDIEPNLRVRVNGRRVYWQSHDALPGGIAFENFEVRQRYRPGQVFVFGVTPKEPWEFDPAIPGVVTPAGH